MLADLVDLDDVGVLEPGHRLGLGAEPLDGPGHGVATRLDHLEGDQPVEGELTGLVDHARPAPAELAEDPVAGDLGGPRDRRAVVLEEAVRRAGVGGGLAVLELVARKHAMESDLVAEPVGELREPPGEFLEARAIPPSIRGA